jgi:GT2 family glycosyltransferase
MITYIFTPICDVFIARALYTLHKFSEPGTFKVIVVDQCKDGFSAPVMEYVRPLIDLYMHPIKHQYGYAKAMNLGIVQAMHQKSEYICLANDDVEFINKRWLDGIWQTFAKDPERIVGVCPMSPRVAGWGYGTPGYPEVLPYKEEYTEADYDYLLKGDFRDKEAILPKTMPKQVGGTIVDGAVFVLPYFKREVFEEFGLLEEKFYPGSGEDTDFMARVYAKNKRIVSTSLSWSWHWWSKSKDLFASGELEQYYYKYRPYWNNHSELWLEGFDVWAKGKDGSILPRIPEIGVEPL